MANQIVAGNSTNGGTAISTDTSGTLNIVTGSGSGANAITIDASQNVAMTASQTIAGNLTVTGTITGTGGVTGGLGTGQTWTDVTASRAGGTTYTNSTGKPISLLIVGTFSSGTGVVSVSVGGVLAGQSQYVNNGGWLVVCTTIVPPSSTYVATFTGSTKTSWYELR